MDRRLSAPAGADRRRHCWRHRRAFRRGAPAPPLLLSVLLLLGLGAPASAGGVSAVAAVATTTTTTTTIASTGTAAATVSTTTTIPSAPAAAAGPGAVLLPFVQRYHRAVYGDVITAGGALSRAAPPPAAADAAGTFDSSTATIAVPAGATVDFALLDWAGDTGDVRRADGSAVPFPSCDGAARATDDPAVPPAGRPARQALQVTVGHGPAASAVMPDRFAVEPAATVPPGEPRRYSAEAEVTALFAGSPGGTPLPVTVANLWTPAGPGCTAGWSLLLVYRYPGVTPGAPLQREVTVSGGALRQGPGAATGASSIGGLQRQGRLVVNGVALPGGGSLVQQVALLAPLPAPGAAGGAGAVHAPKPPTGAPPAVPAPARPRPRPGPPRAASALAQEPSGKGKGKGKGTGRAPDGKGKGSDPASRRWRPVPSPARLAEPEPALAAGAAPPVTPAPVPRPGKPATTHPALRLVQVADHDRVRRGEPVRLTISVLNTGDVPLAPVTVTVPQVAGCRRVYARLDPGGVGSFDCMITSLRRDLRSQASATGVPPSGPLVAAGAEQTIRVQPPALSALLLGNGRADLAVAVTTALLALGILVLLLAPRRRCRY